MLDRIRRRREQEREVKNANRLPPGQSLTQKFPVLHYGPTPYYQSLDTWTFRVFGAVEEEKVWSWSEFNLLPSTDVMMDIHCVTRWSKFDTRWSGVSLRMMVDEGFVAPLSEARYIIQHCENGFTTNMPLDFMLQENVLLATHFDGAPLTRDHGYPLRVVVGSFADRSEAGNKYFWKGGKWLRALEFRVEDEPGFWEQARYHNDADPWKEERLG